MRKVQEEKGGNRTNTTTTTTTTTSDPEWDHEALGTTSIST